MDGFDFTLAWTADEFEHRSGDDWKKGIYCFNQVEGHPDMLMAWVGGSSARTVDRLPDEKELYKLHEIHHGSRIIKSTILATDRV